MANAIYVPYRIVVYMHMWFINLLWGQNPAIIVEYQSTTVCQSCVKSSHPRKFVLCVTAMQSKYFSPQFTVEEMQTEDTWYVNICMACKHRA